MDELVKLVVKKTGIPEATAKQAVEVVLDFLKDRLPEPIADRLDDLLEGNAAADLLGSLGGLFGGK
jgi:uncharacterized protein (DUF2267 family)